jgi:antitoxin YefM
MVRSDNEIWLGDLIFSCEKETKMNHKINGNLLQTCSRVKWYKVIDMEQISTHEMKTNLSLIFDRINHNHEVMKVVRNKTQSVILLDANDYNSLMETLYLLQNQANAERLRKGIEQHRQGQMREIDVKAYVD